MRQAPVSGSFAATAARSASGSLAITMSASTRGGRFEGQVQGAGLFRVGEVHRGEVRVRLAPARATSVTSAKPAAFSTATAVSPAHAVHGGQDDLQVAGREVFRDCQRRDGAPRSRRRSRAPARSTRPRPGRSDSSGADGVDLRRDQGVVRCHDLGAAAALLDGMAAQVHLVAVVLRRVVAGGDHDAAVAVQRPHRVGEQRGGQRGRHQEGFNAGRGEDRRGFLGENIGVVAGVETDDGARPGPGGGLPDGVGEEGGEAGGGAAHHHAVHPVRTRAQGCPQSRGAELQGAAEAVGQFLAGRGTPAVGEADQLGQGGGGGGVRVLVCPVAGVAQEAGEFGIRRRHRNQTIAIPRPGQQSRVRVQFPRARAEPLTPKFPDT